MALAGGVNGLANTPMTANRLSNRDMVDLDFTLRSYHKAQARDSGGGPLPDAYDGLPRP